MNGKTKIIIATHKEYPMPKDKLYVPVHVGAKLAKNTKLSYQRDDDGENISDKNPYYCELTGLYWAWKNQDKLGNPDYIGLAHYRRHFALKKTRVKGIEKRLERVLKSAELKDLKGATLILPKKRNYYYVENLYSHYCHTMEPEPLIRTGEIIKKYYPEYSPEFEKLKKRTTAHMFNMFIMDKDLLNSYCEWLFDILAKLEKEMSPKIGQYDPFQARFYGRVSERLLDVYLRTNKINNYTEIPVVDIEGMNWIKKGIGVLSAKIGGKQYDKSW